jgi:hypothetical protein
VSEAKRILRLGLLLGAVAGGQVGYAEPSDFVTEMNHAREAMLSEPSKGYYDGPFNKAFYARYSGWLNHCTQRTGQALADLDLLVTLDSQGKVSALRVQPESGLSECFAEQVAKEQFPPPPSAGLVVPVGVRITKQ